MLSLVHSHRQASQSPSMPLKLARSQNAFKAIFLSSPATLWERDVCHWTGNQRVKHWIAWKTEHLRPKQAKCLSQSKGNSKLLVKHHWERSVLTWGWNDQQLAALNREIQALGENFNTFSEDADKSFKKLISPEAPEAKGKPREKAGEVAPIYSDMSSSGKSHSPIK